MNHRNLETYVYSHGSMKEHMYLCEACILRLCRNGLKFFWQACTPKLRSHTGSQVFLIIFLLIIFFCVLNETKEGEFHLGPNRFFYRPSQNSYPQGRAHQSLCKSLAPFQIFSWVDSVQPIIKRSHRAEILLNLRKQQTISEKFQTWCFRHTWHVQA